MLISEIENQSITDACTRSNALSFYRNTKSNPRFRGIQYAVVSALLALTLTGCNHVAVKANGLHGSFEVTNNGTDKISVIDNTMYLFPKKIDTGDRYKVEFVPDSGAFIGQTCAITGGSAGDGSGVMVSGGVTVSIDCDGT